MSPLVNMASYILLLSWKARVEDLKISFTANSVTDLVLGAKYRHYDVLLWLLFSYTNLKSGTLDNTMNGYQVTQFL